jgi:hypothetical protein
MNRILTLFVAVAFPAIVLAQAGSSGTSKPDGGYQPAVPSPSTMNACGGWPGYSGGGTAAGNALSGMASVISAQGDYNLSTSAAAVNMTQAEKNDIQNRQLWTNTYFEMRATNRAARAAERGPKPTMEQIARMAKDGVPKSLDPTFVDPVTGQINWPGPLQGDGFEAQRGEVQQLFNMRARYGGLGYQDQAKLRTTVDSMAQELRGQIRQIPPTDYVACRDLLRRLNYAATKTDL